MTVFWRRHLTFLYIEAQRCWGDGCLVLDASFVDVWDVVTYKHLSFYVIIDYFYR